MNQKTCEAPVKAHRGQKDTLCGKPAVLKWVPRNHPDKFQFMCFEHGKQTAGNFVDELRQI